MKLYPLIILILLLQTGIPLISQTVEAEKTLDQLINLFKAYHRAEKGDKLTEKQTADNQRIKLSIEKIFDYEALIHGTLKDQESTMSAAQKDEIFNRFKMLIELIALPQGSYFYNHSENTLERGRIKEGQVIIPSKNYNYDKDLEISLDYIFEKKESRWKMVDLILNNHSLVDAYRRQINRVVTKNGVQGLINELDKKLKELTR